MVQTQSCTIRIEVLMSVPFSLFYGDSIEVKVIASNILGQSPPSSAKSTSVLIPYISGQLEFGSDYYEFDNEHRVYPTDAQLSRLDV